MRSVLFYLHHWARRSGWRWVLFGMSSWLAAEPFRVQAQTGDATVALRFGQATERDGMPSANTRSLSFDRAGFLWVGSEDGLARYDGRTFTTWRTRRADSTSLPNGIVLTINEDAAGYLWVGTHGGIGRFDPPRQTFRTWRAQLPGARTPSFDYDSRVWVGATTGAVWAATPRGLYRYHARLAQWQRQLLPNETSPASGLIGAGLEDRAGRFWCGASGRVWVLDSRTGQTLAMLVVPTNPGEQPRAVTGFMQDAGGRVWATAWGGGLVSLTDAAGALTGRAQTHRWDAETVNIGRTDIAYATAETVDPATGQRTHWMASERGLLRLKKPRNGGLLPAKLVKGIDYEIIVASPDDAPLAAVTTLLADPVTGRLWVGTANGLRWHDAGPALFTTVPVGADLPRLDPFRLRPDRDPRTGARQYWLSSWYGNGLALLDSALRTLRTWPHLPIGDTEERTGQMCDVVRSRIDGGTLWVATYGGLVRFDPITGSCQQFLTVPSDSTSLTDTRTISLLEDHTGRLWIGTMRGLTYLETSTDFQTGHFRRVAQFRNRAILNMSEDAAGRVWIGTDEGLICAPAGPTGPLNYYRANPQNPHALTHNHVGMTWPLPDGRVWIATRDGLSVWRPETDDFEQFHSGRGMPVDNIYGALPDADGHWWLLTPRGLVRAKFPNGPFRVFDTSSGLPQTDLNGLLAPLADGRFVIGLNRRLIIVDPKAQRPNRHRPRVALTGIALFGKDLPLSQALDSVKHFTFGPDDHTLTFRFAALDFADPKGNRCEYQLVEAAEKRAAVAWQTAPLDGVATFSHLPGGEYALFVRARNADGLMSARESVVRFRIRLPFWQTAWFRLTCALLVVAGLAGYLRVQRQRADKRARLSREMADLEIRALRAQLQPHFVFNALNAVQELVLNGRANDAGSYLARFARLLRLVLESADRATVPLATELEMLRLYADIEQLRLVGLDVVFDIDPDLEAAAPAIPPMMLQPYLENAFWHGVAARPPHERRVVVLVTFGANEHTVHAQIDDTGIGRAAAAERRGATGRAGRTSKGQHLTERHLTLLGATDPAAPDGSPVRITDLRHPTTGAVLGTRVEVWLPVMPPQA